MMLFYKRLNVMKSQRVWLDVSTSKGQVTTPINDISTQILIDPYGIIFDAKTKKPVAGATVILVDENDQPVGNNIAFEVDRTTGFYVQFLQNRSHLRQARVLFIRR